MHNTDLERLFWVYGFTRRPARAVVEVIGELIDRSSLGGGVFDLGSATFDLTRILTGQLDAYVEPGARMVAEIPGMREEFARVGGGHIVNNSPYDLAAAALCLEEGGAVITDALGRGARAVPAARLRTGVPHLLRRGRFVRPPSDACRGRGTGHGAPAFVGYRGPASTLTRKVRPKCFSPSRMAHKSLADYTHIVGRPLVEEIRELAEPLKGKRVVQLSATAFGGGVSEILYTLIPLMRDVGLEVEWQVIYGREEFFNSTKLMHNALQGNPQDLTEEQWATWFQYNEMNARELSRGWDICLVHDPQPAAMLSLAPEKAKAWVWRCHIDVSTPNPADDGAAAPVHHRLPAPRCSTSLRYVPPGMDGGVNIVPPAIDPLAPKNMALSIEDATFVCKQFGIDTSRPMMCQVSRFDPWKDPLGVIDAYRIVKEERPDVQLALVGSMASDDPEGWDFYNSTLAHADGDPDIHILNNFNNVGAIEVNAFQSLADVVIQKSTKEGFGLTVSARRCGRAARSSAATSAGSRCRSRTARPATWSPRSRIAPSARSRSCNDPALGKALGRTGQGARPRALPHAPLPPRLSEDLPRGVVDARS